jgi:Fe-S-cluster formation regulator IscX/YfhJ
MTKIIEILRQRSDPPKDDIKIELKLYNFADDLVKKCRTHLKRIITVLPEFDLHDEKHSEKVLENIEMLLGDEKLNSLSVYELFLLYLSAFFHDCAMAPSDWEINTMKLTEGNENYYQDDFSIKHDLKTPLKYSIAEKTIIINKTHLYKEFESDVKEWMFTPQKEEELIKYLSSLLIEYQNYRNGFADKLKVVKNKSEFVELNEFIRTDYIRSTHHTRIGTYIKNLETTFDNAFEQGAWGKKLAHDLSSICRAHGENSGFIEVLDTNAQYYGSESANLQFVAILLRLGDIIHFSFDRAPIDLRNSKLFKSEYSFQQWAIKSNGVNYSIDNGKISFRAYCQIPETYFKLHQYIDWIEFEIQTYFRFQRRWSVNYIDNLQDKVDRSNIKCDEETFLPKRGLGFSLNQKRIIDLLMGVGLYKDKYACLRELYQNSLDAVRCMLSQNEIDNRSTTGIIEFKINREENRTYLCCIDNGIGMTKDVIENYLLRIGNSYYKSADFYKQQAKWGSKFTPISQFGIGILSCFMIGDKIEITTKVINEEYVSCTIDGPHENFYYKKTSSKDEESIPVSGTMVKVLLNDVEASQMNNKKLSKIGLLLLGLDNHLPVPEHFRSYLSYAKNWEGHLFSKINHFVQIVPSNINLIIKIEDGSQIPISSKPILINFENKNLEIEDTDFDFIDYINNYRRVFPLSHKYEDIKNFVETYELSIPFESTEYITTFTLPKKEFVYETVRDLYAIPKISGTGICIDGIYIERNTAVGLENYYSYEMSRSGIINFFGELRPQLSVDRTSIIHYPENCEKVAEELSKLLILKLLDVVKEHISKNSISPDSVVFNLIWEYMFEKIWFADTLFINEFSYTEHGNIMLKSLNDKLVKSLSIRNFLLSEDVIIKDFNLSKIDILTKKIFLTKLISAKEINIEGSNVTLKQENIFKSNLIPRGHSYSDDDLLVCVDKWEIFNGFFDIISNLYPLVPKRLFDLLEWPHIRGAFGRIKTIYSYSNGIVAFFSQNPLLINEKLGMYIEEKDFWGREKNDIYNFEKKRSKISLFELNDRFLEAKQKERYVLVVYISPCELTAEQDKELEKYTNTDPSYIKGVREGWSLLVTSMEKENIIICPGITTREYLVSLISDDFWETYKDFKFKFTDNTIMERNNEQL